MLVQICDWRGNEIMRAEIALAAVADGFEFSHLPIADRAADEAATRHELIKVYAGGDHGEINPHTPRRVDGSPLIRWHREED